MNEPKRPTVEELKEEANKLNDRIDGLKGQINHLRTESGVLQGKFDAVAFAFAAGARFLPRTDRLDLCNELRRELESLKKQSTTDRGLPNPYWTNEKTGQLRALESILKRLEQLP